MLSLAHLFSRRLVKPLAVTLALFSFLFLVQLVPHAHANNHEASACRICQVGHLGVAPAVSTIVVSVPFVSFGQVSASDVLTVSQEFSSHSPSRAPPSSLAS